MLGGREEESHSSEAKVTLSKIVTPQGVNLRVGVHVIAALDVDHHQLTLPMGIRDNVGACKKGACAGVGAGAGAGTWLTPERSNVKREKAWGVSLWAM